MRLTRSRGRLPGFTQRGVAWLLAASGEETKPFTRFHYWLAGQTPPRERRFPGWPWYPGTSAWVVPTALSILALRKALRDQSSPAIRRRLDLGCSFLINSACSDGGWNYGCPRALGHDAPSYPETTGVAILAASGIQSRQVRQACTLAQKQLLVCRTSEAQSWLRLGLLAHSQLPPRAAALALPNRTTQSAALALLASTAEQGRNIFLE